MARQTAALHDLLVRLLTLFLIALLATPSHARLGGGSSYSSSRSSSRSYSSSSSRSYSSGSSYRGSYSSGRSSGSSYSSGRSHSGGGYSSGYSGGYSDYHQSSDGFTVLVAFFFFLFVIIALLAFFTYGVGSMARNAWKNLGEHVQEFHAPQAPDPLENVKANDFNFSEPSFKAFLHLLFSRFHNERGKNNVGTLAAYFEQPILRTLANSQPVSDVVVGASRYLPVRQATVPIGYDAVMVEFEATYNEGGRDMFTVEHWLLARKRGVLSKDPEAMLNLGCPSCGNPGELNKDGSCPFCDQVVNRGTFQWKVMERHVTELVPKPPIQLDPGGEEAGTYAPTIFQPNFEAHRRAFIGRHPDFVWDEFRTRVVNIFMNLQEAWTTKDFEKARPFETDTLFDTHRYWIERYKEQGLTNVMKDIQVVKVVPCRIERDAFYELITVRIFASMKDYTVDDQGRVVSGHPTADRKFSEYWTFLRRIGAAGSKVRTDLSSCPRCGAPLQINQAGICEHCSAKVTSGEFDWVLASIEQDESYTGNVAA